METISRGDTLDDIINFVFPPTLQHPLAAARLVVYGMYGPLVSGELRSGSKKAHIISTWELNAMCLQIEREDILNIYLHKGQKFELLSRLEQDALINQADVQLKKAKGKASLPQITKTDIRDLLHSVSKDGLGGILAFHEVQKKIIAFREEQRVSKYKLVYPNLATTSHSSTGMGGEAAASTKRFTSTRGLHASAAVADPAMFLKGVGQSDADRVGETGKLLSKHAFKICNLETANDPTLAANVRMLRGNAIGPSFSDPYESRNGSRVKARWDDTSNMTAVQVGSLVLAAPSATTWKRKATMG